MDKQNSSFAFKLCLGCSALLNLLFFSFLTSNKELTWSRNASREAEAIASISCSGHGRAHLDGLVLDGGEPVCECNACYTGADCSQMVTDCVIDADSGNPMFLEPFWRQNAAKSAVMMAGWHRMGYEFEDGSLISKQVEKRIRMMHDRVGNAVTDGSYIVFGAGSTQLLNAAVHALSHHHSSSSTPAKVVASAPYYPVYKSQTQLFESAKFKFHGDTTNWINNSSPSTSFIEFVTSPNNPDGKLNKAVLQGENAKHIYDLAYFWPHYTPISSPMHEDLMIFTLSKLTGHAGSRFGWAIVKDKAVYERMVDYMDLNTYGVSRETQLRTLKLLNVVMEENARKLFDFGYDSMRSRWGKLSKIFSGSKRFSLQDHTPKHCTFSEEIRTPTPAFAWIKCENQEDGDCHAVLREAKIIGRAGHVFGAERRYVRLSLVNSQDEFDVLQNRLEMLVLQERMVNQMARMNVNNFSAPLNGSSTPAINDDLSHHLSQELALERSKSPSHYAILKMLETFFL